MPKFGNRVKETTATTGTGSLDLDGAPTGFRSFADEFSDADDEISYLIVDDPDNPTQYEFGKGTFNTGTPNTLDRDTVEGSTNSGSKVSWTTGTKTVIATPTAADFDALTDLTALADSGGWAGKSALVRAITASDTMLAADDGKLIDADASGNSPATLTYTLLAAATAGDGASVTIKNSGSTGSVVIDGDGSETIDGALTLTLYEQYEFVQLRCDGTAWHVVGKLLTPGVVSVTGAYSVTADDNGRLIVADASGNSPAALTITLGSAATLGENFGVVVKNTGASGTVTVDTSNSPADGIDGAASVTLDSQYDDAVLRCDGSTFHRLSTVVEPTVDNDMEYISTVTASSDSSVAFTGLSSSYYAYKVIGSELTFDTDRALWIRTDSDSGASYDSGSTDYEWGYISTGGAQTDSGGDSKIVVTDTVGGVAAGEALLGLELTLYNPSDASSFTGMSWQAVFMNTNTQGWYSVGAGVRVSAAAVDAIQILPSAGSFSGVFKLYGIKGS